MKKLLSLDISSSTIGWSVFTFDGTNLTLIDCGYYKPIKKAKGCLSLRLKATISFIEDLVKKTEVDDVICEDYAKRFSKGRSSANTIILLALFNQICQLASFNVLNRPAYTYAVSSIRAAIGRYYGVKIVSKDEIFPVLKKHSNIFLIEKNKRGNIKVESGDIADSMAVGMAHVLIINKGKNIIINI